MLQNFMKSTSKSEQAVNRKIAEREKNLISQKNRLKIKACIN